MSDPNSRLDANFKPTTDEYLAEIYRELVKVSAKLDRLLERIPVSDLLEHWQKK